MRIRSFAVALVLAAGLAPGAADAGTLVSATWTQEIQGIALTVTNGGATCTDANPNRVPGAGFLTCPTAGLQATGTTTGTAYNVSLTMPLFAFQVFTTGGVVNLGTRVSLSGAQQIVGNGFSATGTPGIAGRVRVGFAMHTFASMWNQPWGGTLLGYWLSVGMRGTHTSSIFGYRWTHFYAWTPGTLTFTGLTRSYEPLPDVVAMGSFALTANGGGTVTLVAPTKVRANPFDLPPYSIASFATVKLTFVPEPATLLLLGGGALVLLRFARRS